MTLTVTLSNITRRWLETSQSGYHMRLTVYAMCWIYSFHLAQNEDLAAF